MRTLPGTFNGWTSWLPSWLPAWPQGLLLVAALSTWYLSLSLIDSQQHRSELESLLSRLHTSSMRVDLSENVDSAGAAVPVSAVTARRLLLDLKVLLPEIELRSPLAAAALSRNVELLENALTSKDAASVTPGPELNRALEQMVVELRQLHSRSRTIRIGTLLSLAALVFAALWSGLSARNSKRDNPWDGYDFETLLFDNVPGAAVVTDVDDRIVAVNKAYSRLTGYSGAEVTGQPITFNHSGQQDEAFFRAMHSALLDNGSWIGEFWLRKKNGEAFSDKVSRIAIRDGKRLRGYLTLSMELMGDEDARSLMLWQAHHDTLTKLPNRNLFQERLSRVLLRALDEDFLGALISIDIDRFKMVNDSIGPAKGDQVLMEAAYRIAMSVRESDTVARLGGDHFVVLLSEIEDLREVERIAHKIVVAIERPFMMEGQRELFVTASVGISTIPQDGSETGELLQKADAARIQVKQEGGNNLAFFEQEMNARAERRMELESALRKAVTNDELRLHYQPVVDVRRGVVTSTEALLRWHHPELGMVSPGEFIPIAEDTGLIIEIGQWVVRECQRQLSQWRSRGLTDLRISLNISAVQIRHSHDVMGLLSMLASGDPQGLTLELTESALIDNSEGALEFLSGARALGCMVALDDFGTGFSSLGYLRNFEFDVLKIDKAFIDELANTRDLGLVASIVSMGRILGMKVVAEGVEELEQVERLKQIGCDFIQGYYYSKPLPPLEFEAFVGQGQLGVAAQAK
ncbi:MAG: EAL domain-containing protein [Pseudomonadales bacterium]